MKTKSLILFIFCLTFLGCSKAFVVKDKTKFIKLNEIVFDGPKIGFENNLIIAKFNIKDLIKFYEKDLKEFERKEIKDEITKLKSIQKDTILDYETNKNSVKFQDYNFYFHELILDKKVQIIMKSNNKVLNRVKYKFMKDRFGGEQATLNYEDGTEIYRFTLRLGE